MMIHHVQSYSKLIYRMKDLLNLFLQRHGKKKEMQADADSSKTTKKKKKKEEGRSPSDVEKEEDALREELRNLRELTQSNLGLVEENKKLMRKVNTPFFRCVNLYCTCGTEQYMWRTIQDQYGIFLVHVW